MPMETKRVYIDESYFRSIMSEDGKVRSYLSSFIVKSGGVCEVYFKDDKLLLPIQRAVENLNYRNHERGHLVTLIAKLERTEDTAIQYQEKKRKRG